MREFIKWSSVLSVSLNGYLDKKLAPLGINSSQFFYVCRICENPGMKRDSLFQMVYRNPSNVTRALGQLEEKGYLEKRPSKEDRRTCYLFPTEKASRDCRKIRAIVEECTKEMMKSFSKEEQELLQRLLKQAALYAFEMNQNEKEKQEEERECIQ